MPCARIISKIGIALFPLMLATGAQAASDQGAEFGISGTAPAVCLMPEPSPSDTTNVSILNKAITVNTLIDATDARAQPWSATFVFDQVMCNYNSFVKITSVNRGMIPTEVVPTVGGEFLSKIDYTVSASWGGVNLTLNTVNANTVIVPTGGANQADLVLVISTAGSTLPLVTGFFQDTIRLNVGLEM